MPLLLVALLGTLIVLWLVSVPTAAPAQTPEPSAAGTYDGGQTEIAAGLQLGEDGRFLYSLSYGALDERASGTWRAVGETIVLDSDPVVAPRFEVVAVKPAPAGRVTVDLAVPDGFALPWFAVAAFLEDGTVREFGFDEGPLGLDLAPDQKVTALVVGLPLFGIASPPIELPAAGGLTRVHFEPNDLGLVDFGGEVLRREDDAFVLQRHDRVLRFRRIDEAPDRGPAPAAGDGSLPPGSPQRRAILDALRPSIEAELGPDVTFVVDTLEVEQGWAFVQAEPQRPGGAPINGGALYGAELWDLMDGFTVTALLQWHDGRWEVVERAIGATDAWYCGQAPIERIARC